MFGMGWTELLVIGIVALIVVGPKDLPVLFRNMGRFMGKAKGMAREFSRAMNDAANDAGMSDVSKTLKAATNPVSSALDGVKDAARDLTNLDPDKPEAPKKAEKDEMRQKIEAATARKEAAKRQAEAEAALRKAEELESAATKKDEA